MLRELREKKGMTQSDLSNALGYSTPQFISNIERGLCQLPVKQIKPLAKLLGVKPEVFIDERIERLRGRLHKVFKIKN